MVWEISFTHPRNLDEGENFAPVLTILTERDWENINFGFAHEVTDLELHTPQRGSPSLMIQLANSSLMLLENTPDGVSSAGRWDHRYLLDVESADMGITDSCKPTILAQRTLSGVSTLVTMTASGNTGLDYTLQSGTGVGQNGFNNGCRWNAKNRSLLLHIFVHFLHRRGRI